MTSGNMKAFLQGQSNATIFKERRIGSALSIGMRIANKFFPGHYYWHCDTNSGCGFNEDFGVDGSPIVFWNLADDLLVNMRPTAFFCDLNIERIVALEQRLECQPDWRSRSMLFGRDNEEVLEVFAQVIRDQENARYAVGSLLADPNGYFFRNRNGEGAPVRALIEFNREFMRIDTILNLNMRTYRMQKANGHSVLPPLEVFNILNKKHWLVGMAQNSGSQWLLAVGRNVRTGSHKALGMHTIESDEGRHILNMVEGKRQGDLLGDAA